VTYDEFVARVACSAIALCGAAILAGAASSSVATQVDRVVGFDDLPRGWVPGIPRDVRSSSRIVLVRRGHRVAAGPTRNGNYCEAVSLGSGGIGGCVPRGGWRGHRGELKPYLFRPLMLDGPQGVALISGSVFARPGQHLVLVYADGTRERAQLTFVGRPIRAAFFFREIPRAHRVAERRLTSLELRRGSTLIARGLIAAPPRTP
jgi:hypothetical protein